ncbi:hypothetical protein HDU79_008767 [Rhizoclosmatium sp. JEL0117]|nr:hypothetical protein HDU79_008767 [Rhizoclosmatium sp. JEL0117]
MTQVEASREPASVFADTSSSPLDSPLKKRKGTPHRSPKTTTDSDLTAVFISFPFVVGSEQDEIQDEYPRKRFSMSPSPRISGSDNQGPSSSFTDGDAAKFSPMQQAQRLSNLGSSVITATGTEQQANVNVRFVGDSFYGSGKYWWTRHIRPSPAVSNSSSDSDSPNGEDGKDESDSNEGERGETPRRGRGGWGRGGGRGRGRGRASWRGKRI